MSTFSLVISEDFWFVLDFSRRSQYFQLVCPRVIQTLRLPRKERKTQKSSLISKEKFNMEELLEFSWSFS